MLINKSDKVASVLLLFVGYRYTVYHFLIIRFVHRNFAVRFHQKKKQTKGEGPGHIWLWAFSKESRSIRALMVEPTMEWAGFWRLLK